MWDGWLCLGGNEVGNTARTLGYAATADCGVGWLINRDCGGLEDALADQPYEHAFIEDAPWFDARDEATRRFYGLYMLGNSGLSDSTRVGSFTEGIADGGVPGDVRYTGKSIRYRAWMTARGEDALEAGMSWLNAALAPSECGMHGGSCGATDLSFFVSCPPPRGFVDDYTPWVERRRNMVPNASAETVAGNTELRRNLIRYSDTSSTTGWSVTSGTVVSEGGRLKYTQNTTSPSRLGATTSLANAKAAGPYVSSFRAQTSDPSILGVRAYLYDSTAAAVRSAISLPLVAGGGENRYDFSHAPTGVFDTVYMEFYGTAITAGAVGYISEPILEAGTIQGRFFNGSTRPRVRQNLSLNPRAAVGAGWTSNDGTPNPVTRGVVPPVEHPLGITTTAMGSSTGTNSALMSLYNIDALGNTGTAQRNHGLWALVTEPGYRTDSAWGSVELPVNEWVYLKRVTPVAAGAWSGITINRISGNASTTARAYVTGLVTEAGSAQVGSYFDGELGAPQGYAVAWLGTAHTSASYLYDLDVSTNWTTTAGSTESQLTGARPSGVNTSVSQADIYQSGQWASTGSKSVKIRPTGVGNASYGSLLISGLTPGQTYTAMAKLRLESPQTGALHPNWVRQLMAQSAGMSPNNVLSNRAPNEAGVHELRVTFTLGPSGDMLLFLMNGSSTTPVWFDDFAIVSGIYDGPFFDGSTPDEDLVRYTWEGAVNNSTSVMDTREETQRPQTDEEYDDVISPMIRHLHNVICISGPLEVETRISSDKQHWGRLVEFTLYAGMPWTFSQTKELELSPTAATVVQDSPFNLVTVPSAELAGAAVVAATNYSTNPSVETNATGWTSAPVTQSGSAPTPFITSGRVTNELQAVGTSSYRIRLLGNGTVASGRADLQALQSVDLSARPAGSRVSVSIWGALLALGGAGVTTLLQLDGRVDWYTAADVFITSTFLKTLTDPAQFGGSVFAQRSMTPPATASKASVVLRGTFDWASGATNSDVRLYADALAVTVP